MYIPTVNDDQEMFYLRDLLCQSL